MGNCQAAEVATVVIQHPAGEGGGRTERAYLALSAGAVMAANPGHYVAAVITSPPDPNSGGGAAAPVKHLRLLRPDDTLLLGRVYRLVSFEEVLKEFTSKRHVKLSRVTVKVKDEDGGGEEEKAKPNEQPANPRRRRATDTTGGGEIRKESERSLAKVMRQTEEPEPAELERDPGHSSGPNATTAADAPSDLDGDLEALVPPHGLVIGRRFARQWRPALQSIAEG